MVDSTGLVVAKYDCYPYGGLRASTVTTDTKVRFTGKYYDGEDVSQYYFGARYLNGLTNRFNSIDPAAGKYPGWSPYVYAACNPARIVDPDGKYAADFHYDFMYFAAAKVMGASPEVARAIATANLNVDNWGTSSVNPMNWGEKNLHFQSAASGVAISSLGDPGSLTNERFGAAMHTYQDVGFAHKGYGNVGGHFPDFEPDQVGQKSDRGQAKSSTIDAIKGTYGMLVARNGGKANITYENFLNICLEYLKQNGDKGFKDIQELVGGKTREEIEREKERNRQEVSGPLWNYGVDRHVER